MRLQQFAVATLCLLLFLLNGSTVSPAYAQSTDARRAGLERALKATVLVLVPDNRDNLIGSGSGTILDAEAGMILTNYHVVGDRATGILYNDEGLTIIGVMPSNLRGSPILKYRATMLGGDPDLDLAVLQINGLFDDPTARLPENLGLTAIERADSDQLMIGDTLYVIGYPGLGGNTVTMSTGLVSGFLDEDNDDVFEWIKTDAEVNRGNSGGLAVNDAWQFIGVPSAGVSEIETAGKISLIRTGNLALQFYDAVLLGNAGQQPASGPRVTNVTFGEAVNRNNEVITARTNFASGTNELYASFTFAGFENGQTFTAIWYRDGRQVSTDTFRWREGERGQSWVSIYADVALSDGFYELELLLDNQSLIRTGVTVGGQATAACRFGEITFARSISDAGAPVDPGTRFGSTNIIYAFFSARGLTNGTPWKTIWSYEGRPVLEQEEIWDLGAATSQWVSLSHPEGLPAGHFALELFCAGQFQQRAEFEITQRVNQAADQVTVTGIIRDRDNLRRRVGGALVLFLQPGISMNDWIAADYSDALVLGSATSDRGGNYQLDAKVTRGTDYTVVAMHDRYHMVSQDHFSIPADASDPYTVDITMVRK